MRGSVKRGDGALAYGARTLEVIRQRLGGAVFVSPVEIAGALDVSTNVVDGWIDAGQVEWIDLGGHPHRGKDRRRTKPYRKVLTESLVEFLRGRVGGMQ
jgi:hypothetical protein